MKVLIRNAFSDEVRSYEPGEIVDFPDEKAARFIKQELAVEATVDKKAAKLEAAALANPEKRG